MTNEKLMLAEVLAALYQSEINCGLQSFWDGGWIVRIGDELNGFLATETVADLESAAAWLDANARRLFPQSWYALGEEEFCRRHPEHSEHVEHASGALAIDQVEVLPHVTILVTPVEDHIAMPRAVWLDLIQRLADWNISTARRRR